MSSHTIWECDTESRPLETFAKRYWIWNELHNALRQAFLHLHRQISQLGHRKRSLVCKTHSSLTSGIGVLQTKVTESSASVAGELENI